MFLVRLGPALNPYLRRSSLEQGRPLIHKLSEDWLVSVLHVAKRHV